MSTLLEVDDLRSGYGSIPVLQGVTFSVAEGETAVLFGLNGAGKATRDAKVLLLGVSYKADIDDTRESPALKMIELLQDAGADVSYHDPWVPELPELGLVSAPLVPAAVDCVVIVTAHSGIDYARRVDDSALVVDLRNATGRAGISSEKVWKL